MGAPPRQCQDFSSKSKQIEFIQYRLPVGPGPSSKTCPKCDPHFLQTTSVRAMPCVTSSIRSTFSRFAGSVKLGQPVPESNLVSEVNSSAPQAAQRYIPSAFVL